MLPQAYLSKILEELSKSQGTFETFLAIRESLLPQNFPFCWKWEILRKSLPLQSNEKSVLLQQDGGKRIPAANAFELLHSQGSVQLLVMFALASIVFTLLVVLSMQMAWITANLATKLIMSINTERKVPKKLPVPRYFYLKSIRGQIVKLKLSLSPQTGNYQYFTVFVPFFYFSSEIEGYVGKSTAMLRKSGNVTHCIKSDLPLSYLHVFSFSSQETMLY